MVYVIYGEDIVSSRTKLSSLVDKSSSISTLDGKKQPLSQILDAFENKSLFGEKRTVVVESFTKVKGDNFLEKVKELEGDKETIVILWEGGEVDKRKISKLKNSNVFEFSFPKQYYAFLDSYSPSSKQSHVLLNEVLKTFAAEQVLFGLIKRVRQLLVIKSGRYHEFSEFRNMQDWQLSKLKKQANFWEEERLKKAFLDLADLDEKIKTGALNMTLTKHLDILLVPN